VKTLEIKYKKEIKMPKKTKLEGLKIESFVTSLPGKKKSRVKGGQADVSCPTCPDICPGHMWTVAIHACSDAEITRNCD
jgi:hypothetical protein